MISDQGRDGMARIPPLLTFYQTPRVVRQIAADAGRRIFRAPPHHPWSGAFTSRRPAPAPAVTAAFTSLAGCGA